MTEATAAATPDQPEPAPETVQAAAPISATGAARLLSLDFTRGIAVMGILAANIVAFGQPMVAYMWPGGFLTGHGETSNWLWVAQYVLVDGKMRGLFTLLFGAGLLLFLDKAWERGQGRGLQARRLFWLLLFGLAHYFFIWKGDILSLYAICGFIGLACVKWRPGTQLGVGITFFLVGALLFTAMASFFYWVMDSGATLPPELVEQRGKFGLMKTEGIADGEIETALIASGNYLGFVQHNLNIHGFEPLAGVMFSFLETIPLMLIGMALYRKGLFDGRISAKKQATWGAIGVLVGLGGSLAIALWAKQQGLTFYTTFFAFVGIGAFVRLPFILGLAALLALWGPKATGWLGSRVTAAGRMAFSNYLGTSILMLLVFHGFGLGLFGELTRPQLYGVMAGAWIIMLLWSKAWLSAFRFGPLEWLWRCLTYMRLFPIRREREAS